MNVIALAPSATTKEQSPARTRLLPTIMNLRQSLGTQNSRKNNGTRLYGADATFNINPHEKALRDIRTPSTDCLMSTTAYIETYGIHHDDI